MLSGQISVVYLRLSPSTVSTDLEVSDGIIATFGASKALVSGTCMFLIVCSIFSFSNCSSVL